MLNWLQRRKRSEPVSSQIRETGVSTGAGSRIDCQMSGLAVSPWRQRRPWQTALSSREAPWRSCEIKQGFRADHGGASRTGHLTWALVLRRLQGRQGLLRQVSGIMRTNDAVLAESVCVRLLGGVTGVFLPAPSLSLSLPCCSDETRSTTWLHPRSGEPVNSGHMIRSGELG